MKKPVETALDIPVIDPVEVGYRTLEMMVNANIMISKKGMYATPALKEAKLGSLLKI